MNEAPRDVRQLENWDCGPTCIESITGVKPQIGSPGFGTSTYGMVDAIRGLGYTTTVGTKWDLEDLKYHCDRGRYAICLIHTSGVSHWVVVWKVARGRVYIHDPEKGPRVIPWPLMSQLWSSDGYESLGIAVTRLLP